MAVPTMATLRSALITALGTVTGWAESRVHYDVFGFDSDGLLPRSFAVSIPLTVVTDRRRAVKVRGSQDGMMVTTTIRARWVHRLRADGQRADYAALLADEVTVMQAAASMVLSDIGPVSPVRIQRRVVGDGTWHLTEVEWGCVHLYGIHDPDIP